MLPSFAVNVNRRVSLPETSTVSSMAELTSKLSHQRCKMISYGKDDVAGLPFGPTAREASENDHECAATVTIEATTSSALNTAILVPGCSTLTIDNRKLIHVANADKCKRINKYLLSQETFSELP